MIKIFAQAALIFFIGTGAQAYAQSQCADRIVQKLSAADVDLRRMEPSLSPETFAAFSRGVKAYRDTPWRTMVAQEAANLRPGWEGDLQATREMREATLEVINDSLKVLAKAQANSSDTISLRKIIQDSRVELRAIELLSTIPVAAFEYTDCLGTR